MLELTVMRPHNPLRVEQAFKPGLLRDKPLLCPLRQSPPLLPPLATQCAVSPRHPAARGAAGTSKAEAQAHPENSALPEI